MASLDLANIMSVFSTNSTNIDGLEDVTPHVVMLLTTLLVVVAGGKLTSQWGPEKKGHGKKPQLSQYTLEDVGKHGTEESCWLVIKGKVYDVTRFLPSHPGGKDQILQVAGKDVTEKWLGIHQLSVLGTTAASFLIGTVGDKTIIREQPKQSLASYILHAPLTFVNSTVHLFAGAAFRVHRLWGIMYLAQFAAVCYLEAMGTPNRDLYWTMPLTGIIQTVVACRTFTFLPNATGKEQGYYTANKVMSYDFILENFYFAGLLLCQSIYLCFAKAITSNPIYIPFEVFFVFLPYYTVRGYFPKSSFRDTTTKTTDKDVQRYAMVVKVFFVIAKHFSGYYINYLCFLGYLGPDPVMDWQLVRFLFITGGWGTTIAMFLQTLKFKKYINNLTAQILYAGSFPFFYACYAALFYVALDHVWITALTAVGLAMNFAPRNVGIAWQCFMCAVLFSVRYGLFPSLQA